jgi:hypothetical protein
MNLYLSHEYETIKKTLNKVAREVLSGDMSLARAHEVITTTPGVTPNDISELFPWRVRRALRCWQRLNKED